MKKWFVFLMAVLLMANCSEQPFVDDYAAEMSSVLEMEYVGVDSLSVVDSIEMDFATFYDKFMPDEVPDSIGRYAVMEKEGKFCIFDTWQGKALTHPEFDELRYAQRVFLRDGSHDILFNMRMGEEIGYVRVHDRGDDCEIAVLGSFPLDTLMSHPKR